MNIQSSQDPDALPQLIGDFHPVDRWQSHINEIFYGLYASRLRDFYQTFASADHRLGYALAEDYYQKRCEREKPVRTSGQGRVNQPGTQTLRVMEWGGGSGNLAACFLDRLKELDKEGTFYPSVEYILIDKFESVIDEARKNADLGRHEGRVTFLCSGAEALESFADGTVDRIICNEFWSDLPTKLLIRRGGEIMEEYIRPNVSEKKLQEITDWSGFVQAFDGKDFKTLKHYPPFLEDLVWEREYHKVEAKELPSRRTISEFVKSLGDDVLIPINIGACATLKEAKRLLAPDAIGFSSFDAGTADFHVLSDPEKPCYTVHGGQLSFMVNLALLKEVGEHLGVRAIVMEAQKEFIGRSLGANVLTLMDLMASHRSIPPQDSWESDAFILETIKAINTSYRSPYQRTIDFPLRETTSNDEREKLKHILGSFQPGGVPDTIAYLTEDEIWGAMGELEQIGYERDDIRAVLTAPPQPVDYYHFSFSPTAK